FTILVSVVPIWTRPSTFILRLLLLLGSYEKLMGFPGVQSIGVGKVPSLWFQQYKPEEERGIVSTLHIGLLAKDTATIDAFYAAAIAAGGKCNGPPGPRPQYTKTYYGAFVHDLDGNNLEAMFIDCNYEAELSEACKAAKEQS
ncbi:hypothetical protein B9Z19DRAFT_981017, partial [Tuber borchii]